MPKPKIAGGVEILDEKARKLLEDNLLPDEAVQFCLIGQRMRDTSPTGDVLVALNERMLVVRHGRAARNDPFFGHGTEAVSLYYADINSLDLRKRFLTGSIRIDRPGLPLPPEIILDKARLDEYRPYIDEINKKIHDARQGHTSKGSAGNEFVAELERLAALRNSGALTDEEFQQAKARLLR